MFGCFVPKLTVRSLTNFIIASSGFLSIAMWMENPDPGNDVNEVTAPNDPAL